MANENDKAGKKQDKGRAKVSKLQLNKEAVKELGPNELNGVVGGLGTNPFRTTCGETNSLLTTCTKIDTATNPIGATVKRI